MNDFITLPNILTVSRIFLLPVFAFGFFMESKLGGLISLSVFIFCCITDYLDGYYARAYKQTTKIGQMLDPLADKILVSIAVLFIVGFHLISNYAIIPAAIILCREVIISGVRDATEFSGHSFKTSFLSKCKTAAQMLSICTILFSAIFESDIVSKTGEAMLWISSFIALVSGFIYCKKHVFGLLSA